MNKSLLISLLLFMCVLVKGQNTYPHLIKIDYQINNLFRGDGFIFDNIGYEYGIDNRNSVGIWIGGDFKTSKLSIGQESKATTRNDLRLTLDYYYFIYKRINKNGIYISPAIYYTHGIFNIDEEKLYSYGVNVNVGYRHYFYPIVLDFILFSGYKYYYEKNNIYTYCSRELNSINIKAAVAYVF